MVRKLTFKLTIAAILLSGCDSFVAPPSPQDVALKPKDKELLAPYVGHDFWMDYSRGLLVYKAPFTLASQFAIGHGHFTIDSFDGMKGDKAVLHVTFDDGMVGYFVTTPEVLADSLAQHHHIATEVGTPPSFKDRPNDKEAADRRKRQGVVLGMHDYEIIGTSWGKPARVETKMTAKGLHETWYYPDDNALYFRDGILIGWKC